MNIVLVGFMGTGKTATGKKLATNLGLKFVDMDNLIVEREGKPISQIFKEDGEPFFRKLEREIAQKLSRQSNMVIATGGGIVLNHENISDFEKSGLVICLSAEPETILKRLESDTSRPLLSGKDKIQKIIDILNSRKELYNSIATQIDTTNMNTEEVVKQIETIYHKLT